MIVLLSTAVNGVIYNSEKADKIIKDEIDQWTFN